MQQLTNVDSDYVSDICNQVLNSMCKKKYYQVIKKKIKEKLNLLSIELLGLRFIFKILHYGGARWRRLYKFRVKEWNMSALYGSSRKSSLVLGLFRVWKKFLFFVKHVKEVFLSENLARNSPLMKKFGFTRSRWFVNEMLLSSLQITARLIFQV